uniref:Isochorismatase domain containing 2 n=1 Tax=Strix occidentalis caurina TaxID=311401 RepID=A0A8D0FHU9_STROC
MAGRCLGRVSPGGSILFLCDMQERFRHSVAFFPQIVAVAARVLQGCRELGVPAVVTEQHPRVLGPTVPELGAHDLPKHPKTCFSMVVPAVEAELRARPHLTAAVLCGIETQACILVRAPPPLGGLPSVWGGSPAFGGGTPAFWGGLPSVWGAPWCLGEDPGGCGDWRGPRGLQGTWHQGGVPSIWG